MAVLTYADSGFPIRDDLIAAQQRAWRRLSRPGRWWSGAERIAIAAEARHAVDCSLCARRKAALSPYAEDGAHDARAELDATVIEAIHRIRTDPGRITRIWVDSIVAELSAERYVELVGVVVTTVAVDTFCRGLGLPLRPLPQPEPGAPTRVRPVGASEGGAWVPWVDGRSVGPGEAWLYPAGRPGANIRKAMSLVPEEAHGFFDLVEAQYIPGPAMRDFTREYRAISHPQIELLAGRVSAINRCEY
jgi:hypothetical protein